MRPPPGESAESDEKNRAAKRTLYELCTDDDDSRSALHELKDYEGELGVAKKKKLCVDDDRVARRFPCSVKGVVVVVVDLWEWY